MATAVSEAVVGVADCVSISALSVSQSASRSSKCMSSCSSGSSETVVASVVDVTQTIGDAETEDDFRGLDSFILLLLDKEVLETELVVMLMIHTTLDVHGQSNRNNIRFSAGVFFSIMTRAEAESLNDG